jgi:hypothetical protein
MSTTQHQLDANRDRGYLAGAEDAQYDDHLAEAEPHAWARCGRAWRDGYQAGWDDNIGSE